MSIRNEILLGTGVLLLLVAGCAQWSTPPVGDSLGSLPRPRLAPDSVVFEVTFVQIPEDQTDFPDRFWQDVDEAVLSAELRRHLAANGFRCGLVGSPLPVALQEVLDSQPLGDPNGGSKMVDPGRQVVARTNRLTSRSGQAGKIVVRNNPIDRLATLSYDQTGRISGETLTMAQCLFSITSIAQGDGEVQLELEPMIEHGEPKSRFRGENGAWMVDNTSRDARIFDGMKIRAKLAPGEAIAITCTATPRGLGEQYFGEDPVEKLSRLLLLVRLQQTQLDSRFRALDAPEPVASTLN